jgi:hypothetical protein
VCSCNPNGCSCVSVTYVCTCIPVTYSHPT